MWRAFDLPVLSLDGKEYRLGEISGRESLWTVQIDGHTVKLEVLRETSLIHQSLLLRAGSRVIRVSTRKTERENTFLVELDGRPLFAKLEQQAEATDSGDSAVPGPVVVSSPMAGKIAAVKTSRGAIVDEGQALVVLEAMKMENEIAAPRKGIVKEIYVEPGALARSGDRLVLIE